MHDEAELIAALQREEITRARQETIAQKFWAGPDLFDLACEFSKAGIRRQHPEFTEEQVMAELKRRVSLGDHNCPGAA